LVLFWVKSKNVELKYFKVIHIQITQIPSKLMKELGRSPARTKSESKRGTRESQGQIIHIGYPQLETYSFQHATLNYQQEHRV
jgi:hypothetical protein